MKFTEEQQMLFDAALVFSRDELSPLCEEMDQQERWPDTCWGKCAAQGFLGAGIAEQYGGLGEDWAQAVVLQQAIARCNPAVALAVGAQLQVGALLQSHGNEAQQKEYLSKFASGEAMMAVMNIGAQRSELKAEKKGSDYILNGRIEMLINGAENNAVILCADVSGKYICLLMDADKKGVALTPLHDRAGLRGLMLAQCDLKNCKIPAVQVLSEKAAACLRAMQTTSLAATALGMSEQTLDAAVNYARERKQFGHVIADFQLIQEKLADADACISAQKAALYQAVMQWQRDGTVWPAQLALTYAAAHGVYDIADRALQVHGGYGYIKEFPVERLWRDAKALQILAGEAPHARAIAAAVTA